MGGGYRREDVEAALTELGLILRELNDDLETLRDHAAELEGQLRGARAEIEAHRAREAELSQAIENAVRRASMIERAAQERAREIVATAEEARGGRPAGGETAGESLELRRALIESLRAAVEQLDQALSVVEREGSRIGAQQEGDPPAEPAPPVEEGEELFEARVEIDAGPFPDFATVSAFERALAGLPDVEDVYVRRVVEGRARIDVTLSRPGPLLQAMHGSLPYELQVRSLSPTELVLDVAPPAGAA